MRSHVVIVAVATLALNGCDGLSDVDEQPQSAPTAKAVVVGHSFAPEVPPENGLIETTVRSGSEVLLSGKESDSDDVPILQYNWDVIDAGDTGLVREDLVLRNNTTVSFMAPRVTPGDNNKIRLRLTVVDANEQTAEANVDVTVEPVLDPDEFLAFFAEPQRFLVYNRLGSEIAPNAGTAGDVTLTFTVETLLDYLPKQGGSRLTDVLVARTEPVQVPWPLEVVGGSAACGPEVASNPVMAYPIPVLDVDDFNRQYQSDDPQTAENERDLTIELRDIDQADLKVRVTLTHTAPFELGLKLCDLVTTSFDGSTGSLQGSVQTASDGVTQVLIFDVDDLRNSARGTVPALDTRNSAEAYYAAIDPRNEKLTFSEWLAANGFDESQPDLGADAHAVYVNNYDLGFGRDMYASLGACDNGLETPGTCDVASVVINYASLEAAAKKIDPIVAVAMEYARPVDDPSGARFTKFYVYAPDLRGEFVRVTSVDLDGRGQKYVPQVCVVCHGGRPGHSGTGDLSAGWLTWDLESFLYSDTDQSFSAKAIDDELRSRYTRAAQEEEFRKLNYFAWLTLHEEGDPERFRRARELVEGWYGGAQKLAAEGSSWREYHRDDDQPFVEALPAGWQAGALFADNATVAPVSAPDTYEDVFAKHCRACHVLHDPALTDDGQLPMGSYEEFIGASRLAESVGNGQMPFARMTMDRFWTRQGQNASPAEILRNHLSTEAPSDNRGTYDTPGTPVVEIDGWPDSLERGKNYSVSALGSRFVAEPLSFTLSSPANSGAALVFDRTARPVVTGVDAKGTYTLTVTTSDGLTSASRSAQRIDQVITVTDPAPGAEPIPLALQEEPNEVRIRWTGGEGTQLRSVESTDASTVGIAGFEPEGTIRLLSINPSSDPITITYSLVDLDGDPLDGAFEVKPADQLTVQSAIAFSETRRQIPSGALLKNMETVASEDFDLQDLVVLPPGASIAVRIEFSQPATAASQGFTQQGTKVLYVPPVAVMTLYDTTSSRVRMQNAFATVGFRACFEILVEGGRCPESSPSGTVTVEIVGRADESPRWSTVDTGLATYCAGCHQDGDAAEPDFMGPIGATDSAVFENTCNYVADGEPADAGGGLNELIVLPGDADNSALDVKPRGGWRHRRETGDGLAGSPVPNPATDPVAADALWTAIRDWINDGAYYTTATRTGGIQRCSQ